MPITSHLFVPSSLHPSLPPFLPPSLPPSLPLLKAFIFFPFASFLQLTEFLLNWKGHVTTGADDGKSRLFPSSFSAHSELSHSALQQEEGGRRTKKENILGEGGMTRAHYFLMGDVVP